MPGKAYAYTRVSPCDRDIESSMDLQMQSCKRYFEYKLAPDNVVFGGTFEDRMESAYKKVFAKRPAGAELNLILERGDHVLFARLDRGFRNSRDLLNTKELWDSRGVTVHFIDLGVDLSTAIGKLFATFQVAMAEWYSSQLSEKVRASHKWRADRGLTKNGEIPLEKRREIHGKDPKNRLLVLDRYKIAIMVEIARLRDIEKLSWAKIRDAIETKLAAAEGEVFKPGAWSKHRISFHDRPFYSRYKRVHELHKQGLVVLPWLVNGEDTNGQAPKADEVSNGHVQPVRDSASEVRDDDSAGTSAGT